VPHSKIQKWGWVNYVYGLICSLDILSVFLRDQFHLFRLFTCLQNTVGARLIRTRSFSGYQQKVPCSLEHWHFHLLQREEVSPKAQLRQKDREGKGEYLGARMILRMEIYIRM
jgi:hypothetical protein